MTVEDVGADGASGDYVVTPPVMLVSKRTAGRGWGYLSLPLFAGSGFMIAKINLSVQLL